MSLADAASPERVIPAVRQDRARVKTVEREHARIPAAGDQREFVPRLCRGVDRREMRGNVCMRIETVDHAKVLRKLRGQLRQVRRAAAAQDHRVDLAFTFRNRVSRKHLCAGFRNDRRRIAPRKDADKLHVGILPDRRLHAASEVPVSVNRKFHIRCSFQL